MNRIRCTNGTENETSSESLLEVVMRNSGGLRRTGGVLNQVSPIRGTEFKSAGDLASLKPPSSVAGFSEAGALWLASVRPVSLGYDSICNHRHFRYSVSRQPSDTG